MAKLTVTKIEEKKCETKVIAYGDFHNLGEAECVVYYDKEKGRFYVADKQGEKVNGGQKIAIKRYGAAAGLQNAHDQLVKNATDFLNVENIQEKD